MNSQSSWRERSEPLVLLQTKPVTPPPLIAALGSQLNGFSLASSLLPCLIRVLFVVHNSSINSVAYSLGTYAFFFQEFGKFRRILRFIA